MDKAFIGTIPDGRRFFAVEREGRRMPLLDGSGAVALWPKWDGYADLSAPDFARVLKAMDNPEGLKLINPVDQYEATMNAAKRHHDRIVG